MIIYVTLSGNDVYIIRSETRILDPVRFFDSYGAFLISQHKNIDKIILKNLLIEEINFRKYVDGDNSVVVEFWFDHIYDICLEYVDCVMA